MFQVPTSSPILILAVFEDTSVRVRARYAGGEACETAGPRLLAIFLVGLIFLHGQQEPKVRTPSPGEPQPALSASSYTAFRRSGSAIARGTTASYELALCLLPSSSSMWMSSKFEDTIIGRGRACEVSMFQVPGSSAISILAVFEATGVRVRVR